MTNIFIFNPLGLENGRGGEISAIELASGLKNFYNITLMDTNVIIDNVLLSKESILKKLEGLEKYGRVKFATFKILNKIFTFPYPNEVIKLYRTVKNNDIIYTSNFTIKTNLIFILFSLLHRKGIFIIGHRKPLFSKKVFSLYNLKNRVSILLFTLIKKRFLHHTISKHAKKYLENFYSANRVIHITHGVELENYKKNSSIQKSNNHLNFIYVGYLDDVHKGVGVLLDGIENIILENPHLKIFFEFCGVGPLEHKLRLLEKNHPKYIKYNGYINNERISEYYKRNDVLLFTSRREPFGRVLVEALASELLIICTHTYGSDEVLKDKRFAYFIPKLNSENIKRKIYDVYDLWEKNPHKFQKFQEMAKNYAYSQYSFSKELSMFRNLINKILND
ncbi:hypothetical protein LCGC14_0469900 [marine sediment metagenome]|uniref:Glycosyl transferase family 1 domain-containing protein n=1 Tax=marine sediment metagenome TaxID=412755 RepID=A0A0F9SCI0_9ZZZZ